MMNLTKPLLIFCLIFLLLFGSSNLPAIASIRTLEEAPGQMLYQSRHTLRDNLGNAWQLILFKRVKPDGTRIVNLRLVDFPGTAEFSHPQPLKIRTETEEVWEAKDFFAEKAPAPNVGQYEIAPILSQLPYSSSLILSVPVKSNQPVSIKVPSVVVLEWQTVATEN